MEYVNPLSLKQALEAKRHYGKDAALLAGGTDLLLRVKSGKESPKALIELNNLSLNYINLQEKTLNIGAMTSLSQILKNEHLNKYYGVIGEAAKEVGAAQTRTLATLGGNICTGLPSADMALPLLILDSTVVLSSLEQDRDISLEEFFFSPRQTILKNSEILTEIKVPKPNPAGNSGAVFLKVGKRKAMRLSIVSIALSLDIDPSNNIINDIKVAMGTVSPLPLRLKEVERLMIGEKLENTLITEAINTLPSSISPRTSLRATREYRTYLAKTLFQKALGVARQRALGGMN